MIRRRHSEETRAAVMAALLSGQGVREVSRQYHLDSGLVSKWKKKIPRQQWTQLDAKKQQDFSELLNRYLKSIFEANIFVNEFIQGKCNSRYLQKQSAAELATFTGVNADKGVRFFEASEIAKQSESLEISSELADDVQKSIQ